MWSSTELLLELFGGERKAGQGLGCSLSVSVCVFCGWIDCASAGVYGGLLGGFIGQPLRVTMVKLQGHGAGMSAPGKPVLGPAGYQDLPGSPGAGPVRQRALFFVLSCDMGWLGRLGYSGAPPGRHQLASAG